MRNATTIAVFVLIAVILVASVTQLFLSAIKQEVGFLTFGLLSFTETGYVRVRAIRI